jgi:eukaryotic-like serine/threonine-protein kinase
MSNENNMVINNRYQLESRLGRGGMAEVWLAHDLLLDRDVAIKILFPEHAIDPNFVERFRREAQAVAGLNHPNIVSVYDWGQSGNTYFMAMEHVQGRTLAEVLRRQGKLNQRGVATVGAAIADALSYAHRNNVVHRDIKPANILVGDDGSIKVVDFGIARALDAAHDSGLTQDGAVVGTATYFSPEQARGESPDLRSDIYSLGVVLYELLAGQPPFSGETALATAYKQVNENPAPLQRFVPDIEVDLNAVVAKCMTKVASQRYDSAADLRDDLRRFVDGKPTRAGDVVRMRRNQKPLVADSDEEVTSVMNPVGTDPNATIAMPSTPQTEVMPASMTPEETLPEYDDESPVKRGYLIGGIAAGVVILGGLLFLIFGMRGSSGVTVPDVKGKTCDVAKAELEAAKFVVALNPADTVCDAAVVVQNQSPAALDSAKSGETVTLVFPVAGIQVPGVKGLTEDAARAAIEGAGFVFSKGPDVIDKTYALGQVAVQTPEGGTLQPKGSTITVNLSGGSGQLAIPTVVVGQTTDTAKAFLQADPYKFVVTVAEEASATVAKGLVIRTDPVVGQLVDKGAAITLYVSSGPQPVAMPNVKNMTEAQATDALRNLGLGVTFEYVDLAPGNANIGKVISQGTAAGTMVSPGTKIILTAGRDSSTAPTTG